MEQSKIVPTICYPLKTFVDICFVVRSSYSYFYVHRGRIAFRNFLKLDVSHSSLSSEKDFCSQSTCSFYGKAAILWLALILTVFRRWRYKNIFGS